MSRASRRSNPSATRRLRRWSVWWRRGFTLIEILIVVVIMAILAATIIPQFTDSTADAEIATTEFNLNTLRAQIELYKAQHGGTPPAISGGLITGLTTQSVRYFIGHVTREY